MFEPGGRAEVVLSKAPPRGPVVSCCAQAAGGRVQPPAVSVVGARHLLSCRRRCGSWRPRIHPDLVGLVPGLGRSVVCTHAALYIYIYIFYCYFFPFGQHLSWPDLFNAKGAKGLEDGGGGSSAI